MSGGMKACLVVLCVVGFCCLLCCGGFAYFGYTMVPKVSNSPAEINAARDEIAQITLPAGFEPKTSAKIDNWFGRLTMVEYSNPGHADLMLMQIQAKIGGPDAMTPIRQSMEKQRVTKVEVGPMQNAKVETKMIKIKGKDCLFTFTTGDEGVNLGGNPLPDNKPANNKADDKAADVKAPDAKGLGNKPRGKKGIRHQINGDFEGKNGLAVIVIDFDDTYKEADIVKMLESIQ